MLTVFTLCLVFRWYVEHQYLCYSVTCVLNTLKLILCSCLQAASFIAIVQSYDLFSCTTILTYVHAYMNMYIHRYVNAYMNLHCF